MLETDFGLNVIKNMIKKGLLDKKCDEISFMAFNISLDYILELFEKYDSLSKVKIYSNSEHISFSKKNKKKIKKLEKNSKIKFFHLSEDETFIHSKMYKFSKNGEVIFTAIGSPNFSKKSNQSFESLVYIHNKDIFEDIWNNFNKLCKDEFGFGSYSERIPKNITTDKKEVKIDKKYLKDLWPHQEKIIKWLVQRYNGIINIPPGTGKTKIALKEIEYLMDKEDVAVVVLVPTTPLINQWKENLEEAGFKSFILGTSIDKSVEPYFANPSKKILITLYRRFLNQLDVFCKHMEIHGSNAPNILLVSDECQRWYSILNDFVKLKNRISKLDNDKFYNLGLSATIDSFKKDKMKKYIEVMGGEQNRFRISLPAYYSKWNELSKRPALKPIKYSPIKYSLTEKETKKYKKLSQRVGIEQTKESIKGNKDYTAAMQRAYWTRNLDGGLKKLKNFISSHIEEFNKENSIIFVQTHEIAKEIRDYITNEQGWDKNSSAYIYDSKKSEKYKNYAMKQFKSNNGFCLVSEEMLKVGFDLPKISTIVLHGSHSSPRDWLQKVGRAIRYDPENPQSIAKVIDIVMCNKLSKPLPMERERYKTLKAISINQ